MWDLAGSPDRDPLRLCVGGADGAADPNRRRVEENKREGKRRVEEY